MEMKDRIRERRIALGMTQEELADRLGLQKSAIAKYENGRVENIKRSVIQKMASVLECTPSYLLCLDDDPVEEEPYYLNPETRRIAQFLFDNPGHRVLLDASRDLRPEDLEFVMQMINRMKSQES